MFRIWEGGLIVILALGLGSYLSKLQDAIDDYGNPYAEHSGGFSF